jgi:hypothetical protein
VSVPDPEPAAPTVRELLDALPDALRPERRNGELVFDAPWQTRAFGIGMALQASGLIDPESFGERLGRDLSDAGTGTGDYYAAWLESVVALATDAGVLTGAEVAARTAEIEALDDHGGDHHGHDHPHGDRHEGATG